jgi:hypothetical protein
MGILMMELGRYEQAFLFAVNALTTFTELRSPDEEIAINLLKKLRGMWGAQEFDVEWRRLTGSDVPDQLKKPYDESNTEARPAGLLVKLVRALGRLFN